jgi:flavin reductase (DIM6/NTAB) family NADH-FMN oxidoreductase RutF
VAATEATQIDHSIAQALPQGLFLMTAADDDARSGFITRWVQQCGRVPFLVSVTIPRGTAIEPLLRDSRRFALCALRDDDRVIKRRFTEAPGRMDDPYVGLRSFTDVTGAPIIRRCRYYLDCELVGQLAMESDCRIYIGQVHRAKALEPLESHGLDESVRSTQMPAVSTGPGRHVNGNGRRKRS